LQIDGHISLSVATDEEQVVIQLQDGGPGIPEERRNKIFDRFYCGAAVWL
jgi:signal transduction histidine kinase